MTMSFLINALVFFLGTFIGVAIMCILQVASKADDDLGYRK